MIEPIPPEKRSGRHVYMLRSASSKEAMNLAAQELLQLAASVEANAERLLDESHADGEQGLQNAPQTCQETREGL
jgi:hypothetical protein